MPTPYDEGKHNRDKGKFSKLQGGRAAPEEDDGAAPPGAPSPADQIRQTVMGGMGMGPMPRDPMQVARAAELADAGYINARGAIDAFGGGDLSAMHHHGAILQKTVKGMRDAGATPDELEKLRRGLTNLHQAITANDTVAAHEALSHLQHGFYAARASLGKEMVAPPAMDETVEEPGTDATEQENEQPQQGPPKKQGPPQKQAANFKSRTTLAAPLDKGAMLKRMNAERLRAEEASQPHSAPPFTFNLHTAPVNNGDPDVMAKMQAMVVETLKSQQQHVVNVTVPPAQNTNVVNVKPTPVKFEATVQPAPVHVQEAPKAAPIQVNVSPTPVSVFNNIEAKPGEMKVNVEAKLPERKARELEFKTDKDGKITGAKEK